MNGKIIEAFTPFLTGGLVQPNHSDESILALGISNGCFSFPEPGAPGELTGW